MFTVPIIESAPYCIAKQPRYGEARDTCRERTTRTVGSSDTNVIWTRYCLPTHGQTPAPTNCSPRRSEDHRLRSKCLVVVVCLCAAQYDTRDLHGRAALLAAVVVTVCHVRGERRFFYILVREPYVLVSYFMSRCDSVARKGRARRERRVLRTPSRFPAALSDRLMSSLFLGFLSPVGPPCLRSHLVGSS